LEEGDPHAGRPDLRESLHAPLGGKGSRVADDDSLDAEPGLDLLLETDLLGRQVIVVLDEELEVAARLLLRVIDLVEQVQSQEVGQLAGVDAVTLVGVFGDPGVGTRVADDETRHPRGEDGADPGGQLAGLDVDMEVAAGVP
jgi:hypothetical protein